MSLHQLETGEFQYGSYKIQYVEWDEGEWSGSGYWLRAVVTNRRLLVYPEVEDQRRHSATIPRAEIVKVWNVSLKGRDGIYLRLNDDRCLYMLVDWSQGSKLVRDIEKMLVPPARPRITPRVLAN